MLKKLIPMFFSLFALTVLPLTSIHAASVHPVLLQEDVEPQDPIISFDEETNNWSVELQLEQKIESFEFLLDTNCPLGSSALIKLNDKPLSIQASLIDDGVKIIPSVPISVKAGTMMKVQVALSPDRVGSFETSFVLKTDAGDYNGHSVIQVSNPVENDIEEDMLQSGDWSIWIITGGVVLILIAVIAAVAIWLQRKRR